MRVLVLHSDVPPGAPPDELDTLHTAAAVAQALAARGHETCLASFHPEPRSLDALLARVRADVVFNLVESVFGQGDLAELAPALLEHRGVPYTGTHAAAIALAADKPLTKRVLLGAGLPTPSWSEPPRWDGLGDDERYMVKSATEDASLGLDDGSVVVGREAVGHRAELCAARHGGRWFAEAYMPGREFNISLLEDGPEPLVLPVAEMRFENWPADRPRLVGYAAKWEPASQDGVDTVRSFVFENGDQLAADLASLSRKAWNLFGLRGYARVDIRLDASQRPMILEINPNPCLEPGSGFAAAAEHAGLPYAELTDRILRTAYGA